MDKPWIYDINHRNSGGPHFFETKPDGFTYFKDYFEKVLRGDCNQENQETW